MPTYNKMIERSGASALVPVQESREIIQMIPSQSVFLRHATRMPDMTSNQTSIPVATGTVDAYFVAGDTGLKQTTNMTWDKVFITAEELAVIVPISEALLADSSYDIWAMIRPLLVSAFGKAIDKAALFGVDKPTSWPAGIVPAAIDAGNTIQHAAAATGPDLYTEILGEQGLVALVEDEGMPVNTFIGAIKTRSILRGALDLNGQRIFNQAYSNGAGGAVSYDILGTPIEFPDNGAWDATTALMLAGDFNLVRYAMRQDITYKLLTEAVITDAEGKVVLNLAQQDSVALRAVMRLGWALPKPVNPVSGTNYYPFGVLTPAP